MQKEMMLLWVGSMAGSFECGKRTLCSVVFEPSRE